MAVLQWLERCGGCSTHSSGASVVKIDYGSVVVSGRRPRLQQPSYQVLARLLWGGREVLCKGWGLRLRLNCYWFAIMITASLLREYWNTGIDEMRKQKTGKKQKNTAGWGKWNLNLLIWQLTQWANEMVEKTVRKQKSALQFYISSIFVRFVIFYYYCV